MNTTKFAQAMNACALTANGAKSYLSPDPTNAITGRCSLFFKGVRGLNIPRLYLYLRTSSSESLVDTFVLAFHLRDCRDGKGERYLGRHALLWLFINFPDQFRKVVSFIPEYGRWDDLLLFFPKVLDLTNIDQVRANYDCNISDEKHWQNVLKLQQEIVELMATQLKTDLKNMAENSSVSLCAKWTPTEGNSLDRKFSTFRTLAQTMKCSERDLRTKYNTPLRKHIKVVEKMMCSNEWSSINFNHVPSQCMKKNKKAFDAHDHKRFTAWKESLSRPDQKTKVNAGALHPHELIREIRQTGTVDPVTQAQYNVIRDEVKQYGSLTDSVVVVDTSGSMETNGCLPLDVAVTIGLLVSEVVEGPFHGHLITFNTVPKFAVIPDTNLYDRWSAVKNMEWGGSTNLEGTFELILERGRQCNLKDEDMPKKLFILSDMQFNVATNTSATNIEHINNMYRQYGYTRPQIVFWNVNGGSTDFPVTVDEHNTVMISGFAPSILKSIISGQKISTEQIIRLTIDSERYDKIRSALEMDHDFVVCE